MPKIRKAIIRQTPFPAERKQAIEKAHEILEKWTGVKVHADFIVIPDFLENAELESDDDLEETWIQEKLNKLQYHIVQVDMTRSEWKSLGIRKTLYGQFNMVYTKWGKQAITYGRWDRQIGAEHADHFPAKYQPIHPLTVGTLHEDSHALAALLGVVDNVHKFFYGIANGERWATTPQPERAFDLPFERLGTLEKRDLMQIGSLLETVVSLYHILIDMQITLLHPIEPYKDYVTQGYGVYKPEWYPQTSHHIGVDIACPVGTPVRAPWDGKVTVAGYTRSMGYFCHYQYTYQGQQYTERYAHLSKMPKIGTYKRGTIVGRTGQTGFVTGPSIHWDIHIDDVDITSLNKWNFRSKTINPLKHYV